MYLRYSFSVVAPIARSSPRASAGFSMFEASIEPSAAPAPTSVCNSSMNRMICPSDSVTSFSTAFKRSSNSPRYFAPAIKEARSSDTMRFGFKTSGTSPATMRLRGLPRWPFFPRRARRSARDCSSCAAPEFASRGESLRRGRSPDRSFRAARVRSGRAHIARERDSVASGFCEVTRWLPRIAAIACRMASWVAPFFDQKLPGRIA